MLQIVFFGVTGAIALSLLEVGKLTYRRIHDAC